MNNLQRDINKMLLKLKATERTLTYPRRLKREIDNSKANDPVAFVKLTPMSTKVTVPDVKYENIASKKNETPVEKALSDEPKLKVVEESIKVDAIILPIRPVDDDLTGQYSQVEGMALGSIGAYMGWKMYKSMAGVASAVLPQEVVIAMKTGIFGGGLDNPHDRMLFAGHQRRSFSLKYDFMKPENEKDERTLGQIVSLLRMSVLGGYGKFVITPPLQWKVSFHCFPNYPNFLQYERCGLTNAQVAFGGQEQFHAMESGMPFLSLSLSFAELDYPTRDLVVIDGDASLISSTMRDLSPQEKLDAEKEKIEGERLVKG